MGFHESDAETIARKEATRKVLEATTPKVKFDPNNITTIGQGSKRSGERGRGDYSLVPKEVVDAYAKHLQEGVERGYPRNNWTLGQPLSRLHSSMLRHAFQLLNGELDEPHDRAVLFNIGAIIYMRAKIKVGQLPDTLEDVFTDAQFQAFYGRPRCSGIQVLNPSTQTISAGAGVDEFGRRVNPQEPRETMGVSTFGE